MTIQAICFDLFGTLIDVFRRADYEEVVVRMASHLRVPEEQFLCHWYESAYERGTGFFRSGEDNVRHVLDILGESRSEEDIGVAAGFRVAQMRRHIKAHDDVLPTLRALGDRGFRLGLLSNCAREIALVWPETDLAGAFDTVILSCEVGLRKPDPAIFLLACQRLQVPPEACLYVGDGDDEELETAAAAGMLPVQIRHPREDGTEVFRRHDQVWGGHRIQRISQVPGLLERLT